MKNEDGLLKCIKSFINERPAFKSLFKSIINNVGTQVLVAIIIGGILLNFNNETLQTIGITIISVALFKFFLTTEALTTLISRTNRETFLSFDFLQSYTDQKLNEIITSSINAKLKNKFPNFQTLHVKNEAFKAISFDAYYQDMIISYNDSVENGECIKSIQKKQYQLITSKTEKIKRTLVFEEIAGKPHEDYIKVDAFIVDGEDLTDKITYTYKVIAKGEINNIKVRMSYPALEEGTHTIEETSTRVTKNFIHAFMFDRHCTNLKIIFEHDENIHNPVIYSKFGMEEVENHHRNKLSHTYHEKVLLPDEMFFITFEKKDD